LPESEPQTCLSQKLPASRFVGHRKSLVTDIWPDSGAAPAVPATVRWLPPETGDRPMPPVLHRLCTILGTTWRYLGSSGFPRTVWHGQPVNEKDAYARLRNQGLPSHRLLRNPPVTGSKENPFWQNAASAVRYVRYWTAVRAVCPYRAYRKTIPQSPTATPYSTVDTCRYRR
jgi:hypothetical protein